MGLLYDRSFLKDIRDEIIWYPMDEQAKLADQVCRSMSQDYNFLVQQKHDEEIDPGTTWNATSVGNMAYLALHCSERHRNDYKALYDRYINVLRQRNSSEISEEHKEYLRTQGRIPNPQNSFLSSLTSMFRSGMNLLFG